MSKTTMNAAVATLLCGVSAAALSWAPASAQSAAERYADRLNAQGNYLTGDKHNHTTCSDGTTSIRTLVDQSTVVYGLDWFAQTGHGGAYNRDCRFDDIQTGNVVPLTNYGASNPRQLWIDTIGREGIKGDPTGSATAPNMWRWQSLMEYAYPDVHNAGRIANKTTWLGLESIVPGHEHVSMGVLGNQFRVNGDAYAVAQFEYLWDRADNDFSGGAEYDFENPRNKGVPKIPNVAGDHAKAVASVQWLRRHYPNDSYYVMSHVERQGAFVPNANNGTNIEHLRDFHNAGLLNPRNIRGESLAFGGEMIPGYHPTSNRGSYSPATPVVGLSTFGGAGCYAAGEMLAPPGMDPADPSVPLTRERVNQIADEWAAEFTAKGAPLVPNMNRTAALARYAFCKPGVRTVWDALLGEGRRFSIFASSDWHSRGTFGPFEPASTAHFWPGEYLKIHAYARGTDGGYNLRAAREVIAGMRAGNSFSVMGDLISELNWVFCQGTACATMGETLRVNPNGPDVEWFVRLRDPQGVNNSPYTFPNPFLLQLGQEVPLNRPVLDNIDIIRGDITGEIRPNDPRYATNVSNPSVEIFASVFRGDFEVDGEYLIKRGTIPASSFTNDMYFRMRGTNIPKGTPYTTDEQGNPLSDYYSGFIPCPFPDTTQPGANGRNAFNPNACPRYLPVNAQLPGSPQVVNFDIRAWGNLWFYANPIFIEVAGGAQQASLR
ncbi:MAG: hypothetical protein ACK4WC_11040 [Rubrimonas sp.]